MKRGFNPIPPLWVVSAALLVGMVVLCIRTRIRSDILGFFTPAGHLQAIASDRDGIVLFFSQVPFGREAGWSADAMSVSTDDFAAAHDLVYDAAKARTPGHWRFAGFRYAKDQLNPTPTAAWSFRAITVPYWALIVLLSILPLQKLGRWIVRKRRLSHGQCLACGYDLRHSADRCPECGRHRRPNMSERTTPMDSEVGDRPRRAGRLAVVLVLFLAVSALAVSLLHGSRGENVSPADHADLGQRISELQVVARIFPRLWCFFRRRQGRIWPLIGKA